ncbi:MAG: 6-bladed beta-propeller [Methanomethylovorans sp.]|nr:6-bladed beta-propeller [Methanomethylovorans sp.]
MNTRNCFIIFFLLTISTPDTIEAQDPIKTYSLTKLPKLTTTKLSDLKFVDIEYIPLETNKQSLMSGIDYIFFHEYKMNKIIPGDGYYLIKNGNKVLKFKSDGSFMGTIGTVGRGPDELDHIDDIFIDNKSQNIFLVSSRQKRICQYSPLGDLIRVLSIPFYIYECIFIDNRILCYSGNNSGINKNSFILIDTLGHIVKNFPNKYQFKSFKGIVVYTHENLFYKFNSRLFKKEIYSDTVYVFENSKFKPHMVIAVGNKLVTPKVRSDYDSYKIYANYIQPINLFEFGNYIYYAFIYKFVIQGEVIIYGYISSKEDNYQALFNLGEGIENDLDGGLNIIPITTKDNHTIISLIDVLTLKKHIATEKFRKSNPKFPEKKKELEKLANSLKDTDNPILMMIRQKK